MSKDWEKLAEDRFKSDEKDAKATAGSHFAAMLVLGILVVVAFAIVDAVRWFFFGWVPTRDDLWMPLLLVVVFPIFEWFYSPLSEARAMRAKRAIRIEAKLDYLLTKNSLE